MITITFISNYLTHHQIPFCEAMYSQMGDCFKFVSTMPMESERVQMGWGNDNDYPFEIRLEEARSLITNSDIVIIGSANKDLVYDRIRINKPVIWYSERFLRDGRWHVISPRAILNMMNTHIRCINKRVWMLCASAYAAGDYGLFGTYWGRCYKWGYFPKTISYSKQELIDNKKNNIVQILWCGRLLRLKHPEMAIECANYLKDRNISFHLTIIGDGEMKDELSTLIKAFQLNDSVSLQNFVAPDKVRHYMEKANIFLFTSDRHEGWGAVLNEAMNSGCACVVSHAVGAAPYLIQDEVNGFIFKSGNMLQLCRKVEMLSRDLSLCGTIGFNAYSTIKNLWNAEVASRRLLSFCDAIINNNSLPEYLEGPLSKDGYLSDSWY